MTARTSRRHGGDVDDGAVALIRFPDERLAHLHTSFGEEPTAVLRIFGEEGSIQLTGAYQHVAPTSLEILRRGEAVELARPPLVHPKALVDQTDVVGDRWPMPPQDEANRHLPGGAHRGHVVDQSARPL